MFPSRIMGLCYLCRRQGGLTIFAPKTRFKIDRLAYVNLPFKPEAQPDSVQTRDPEPVNILSALVENERAVHKESDWERRAIALAWLSSEQHCKNLNHTLTSADGLTQSSVERLVRVR
jgi:hypothetical protein